VVLPNSSGSFKVYAATVPPFAVTGPPNPVQEQARLLVNEYILSSLDGYADGVVDFSEAVSTGIEEGSTATYDTVLKDYLYADGTTLRPGNEYYGALASQYLSDADRSDWFVEDQSGGTEDGSDSIAVWEFDDNNDGAGGTTARDTGVGTGANRTLHPARLTDVAWGKSRQVGVSAGTFNGASSYGATDLRPNTTASYTIAAWVRLTDGSADRTVFARGASGNASLRLYYKATTKHWAAEVYTAASGDAVDSTVVESDAEAKIGVWTHLAVSYDAEGKTLSLFADGNEDTNVPSVTPFNDPGGATWIGRGQNSFFAGDIAGVRVWARPLGEAEVAFWARPIEVLDWELNFGNTPTEAEDDSPYHHPGTVNGGASYSCPGHARPEVPDGDAPDECAAHFDGVGGTVTGEAALNTDQSFSVSAWVRLQKTDANYTVVSQDGGHVARFLLQWSKDINSWRFLTTDNDAAIPATEHADAPPGMEPNKWTHLVGVYDAAADTLSLYVNGEKAQTTPSQHRWNATGEFAVGRASWNDHKADYVPGDIDAVRVYQGAISADQVAELYTR
jgi:hypothetical protein